MLHVKNVKSGWNYLLLDDDALLPADEDLLMPPEELCLEGE
jgi:hypothetical protein